MNYFEDCQSADECKTLYRSLFMQYRHDATAMQCINAELKYKLEAIQEFQDIQAQVKPQPTPQAAPTNDDKARIEQAATFARILPGLTVKVANLFVWVEGTKRTDTTTHELLKGQGFRYSKNKNAWYFTTMKFYRHGTKTPLPQIIMKYGNEPQEQNIFN